MNCYLVSFDFIFFFRELYVRPFLHVLKYLSYSLKSFFSLPFRLDFKHFFLFHFFISLMGLCTYSLMCLLVSCSILKLFLSLFSILSWALSSPGREAGSRISPPDWNEGIEEKLLNRHCGLA